jgi:hypothetical protein
LVVTPEVYINSRRDINSIFLPHREQYVFPSKAQLGESCKNVGK